MEKYLDTDIGAFLQAAGLHPVRELDREIERTFGLNMGGKIIDSMIQLFDQQDRRLADRSHWNQQILRDTEMVEMINSSKELSLLCSGYYDLNVFRIVLSKICQHSALFTGSVLDMGCGNGIIDCFVGWRYPEIWVTGTDLSPNACMVAGQLAQSLDIGNVAFPALEDVQRHAFNTVLSIRTVHENTLPLLHQNSEMETICRDSLHRYADLLKAFMTEDGMLFAFERVFTDANWQLLIEEYDKAGLYMQKDTEERLECETGEEQAVFRFALFSRENEHVK